jgi:RNA polymerase sigma factor (sigma-70 family)
MLVILSEHAVRSTNLVLEAGMALGLYKAVTPVLVDLPHDLVPQVLRPLQYVTYSHLDAYVQRLAQVASRSTLTQVHHERPAAGVAASEERSAVIESAATSAARSLRRRGASADEASEAVGRATLKALMEIRDLGLEDDLGKWFMNVAWLEYVRLQKIKARETPIDALVEGRLIDAAADALTQLEARETFASLRNALGKLAPHDRDLIGRWLEGQSVMEIAEDTGRGPESVSRSKYRALRKLHELLRKVRVGKTLQSPERKP